MQSFPATDLYHAGFRPDAGDSNPVDTAVLLRHEAAARPLMSVFIADTFHVLMVFCPICRTAGFAVFTLSE